MYTENQIKILALLLNNPNKEFYLSELAQIIGKKPGNFQKGVNALELEGIIKSRYDGNRRLFITNSQYPLLKEIKSIVQKTAGVEGLVKQLVENIDGIELALIFGSYARDMMRIDSDIDILLAGDPNIEDDFITGIEKIEQLIQREINYRFYSRIEFIEKRLLNIQTLSDILSDGYILIKGKV